MSEAITQIEEQAIEQIAPNPFDDNNWSEQAPAPVAEKIVEQPKETIVETTNVAEQPKEEVVTTNEWYKDLGWDSAEAAKAQIEELKKPKEPELKFENEESKQLFEALSKGDRKQVLATLKKQEQLEELVNAEVSIANAADIVKANMKFKYAELGITQEEVDRKFNKQFGIPSRPVQSDIEDETEYQARVTEWENTRSNIESELLWEAKLAKPDLAKLKSEIVFPNIPTQELQQTTKPPTQEELEADRKFKETFVQSVQTAVGSFKGFDVSVKDKDTDLIPLSYDFSPEEKLIVETKLKSFAEKNFDANALFAERWVNGDNTLNVNQMVEDFATLEARGKMSQKFANDAANKRLELYLKERKNINVNETTQSGVSALTNEKTEMDKVRDAAFA
jgi:hypothetical protein